VTGDEEKEKREKQGRHEEKEVVSAYGVEGGYTSSTPVSMRCGRSSPIATFGKPRAILSHMCAAAIILQ
jgi:hypothetical protein